MGATMSNLLPVMPHFADDQLSHVVETALSSQARCLRLVRLTLRLPLERVEEPG